MKSIDFPKANIAIAKDQPQYQTLYAHVDKSGNDKTLGLTCCLELSGEELSEVLRTGKIWFTQLTFGRGYNPIRMSTSSPFSEEESASDILPVDENRVSDEEWKKTHYQGTKGIIYPGKGFSIIGPCSNCGKEENDHFWSTRQCKL